MNDLRLAERDHVIRSGISRAPVSFAVQPLGFQKQYRIVAADCGAQQSSGIERVRWEDNPEPRNVREHALAALRVINCAAGKISADGDSNYDRARKSIIRTPADYRQLIANLHHGRPDVVEELNLDYRLQAALSHSRGAAHDGGLGQRRVEDAVRAKLALQAEGEFEDSALALYQLALQVFFAAAIGHVFTEDHDALVALHFIAKRYIDQIGHGFRSGLLAIGRIGTDHRLRIERRRSGIEIRRIHILQHALRRGRQSLKRFIDGNLQLFFDLLFEVVDAFLVEDPFPQQKHLGARNRIARGIALAFGVWTVQAFIIGERVRIGTDDMRVYERRTLPLAAILHGTLKRSRTCHWVGAINLFEMEVRKPRDQPRNTASGGLYFDRHGDGVAVILHDENYRQFVESGSVHRLPEFALAGGAVAERDICNLVAMERHIFELAIIG